MLLCFLKLFFTFIYSCVLSSVFYTINEWMFMLTCVHKFIIYEIINNVYIAYHLMRQVTDKTSQTVVWHWILSGRSRWECTMFSILLSKYAPIVANYLAQRRTGPPRVQPKTTPRGIFLLRGWMCMGPTFTQRQVPPRNIPVSLSNTDLMNIFGGFLHLKHFLWYW